MELKKLFEEYIIVKDRDRELYFDIKDNIGKYESFLVENLGYKLIIREDFIKLEKVPAIPKSWMGFEGFEDKKDYMFLVIVLMYLEDKNKEEQFILSNLLDYIKINYTYEKLEWTERKNRRSLIKALNMIVNIGGLKKIDGTYTSFEHSEEGEILYESTGISRYIIRRFDKDIHEVKNISEVLGDSYIGVGSDRGVVRRQRVYRSIVLNPVVYNEDLEVSDVEYIRNYRNRIREVLNENLGWDVHFHKTSSMIVLDETSIKDVYPNKKGETRIILLFNKKIRELIKENKLKINEKDYIELTRERFNIILEELREEEGHGFVKDYRECSVERYINDILKTMKNYELVRIKDSRIVLLPLLGKIIGDYPKEYREKIENE